MGRPPNMPSNCRLPGVKGAVPGALPGVKGEEAAVVEVNWEMGEVDLAAGAWSEVDNLGTGGSAMWLRRSSKRAFKRWEGMGNLELLSSAEAQRSWSQRGKRSAEMKGRRIR